MFVIERKIKISADLQTTSLSWAHVRCVHRILDFSFRLNMWLVYYLSCLSIYLGLVCFGFGYVCVLNACIIRLSLLVCHVLLAVFVGGVSIF